jgi:uncharacterized protein
MAKAGQTSLESITGTLGRLADRELPPVEKWNPPFCCELDMRIAADGTWFYLKTPIGRPALVRLFASVLKREGDKYFLVTPVEKCGIVVDDAPFLAVELRAEQSVHGRVLNFRTNVDDWVPCGPDHALRFEPEPGTGGLKPYLHVRRGLWAKVTRALFFDLVELGEEQDVEGRGMFGVSSMGTFFPMAPAEQARDFA